MKDSFFPLRRVFGKYLNEMAIRVYQKCSDIISIFTNEEVISIEKDDEDNNNEGYKITTKKSNLKENNDYDEYKTNKIFLCIGSPNESSQKLKHVQLDSNKNNSSNEVGDGNILEYPWPSNRFDNWYDNVKNGRMESGNFTETSKIAIVGTGLTSVDVVKVI